MLHGRVCCTTELRETDSGSYTCLAVSETGETSWPSDLLVRHPTGPSIVFHQMPDASTFPAAPTRPTVTVVTETSVTLSWKPSDNHGASPVNSYAVEYVGQHSSTVGISIISLFFSGQGKVRGHKPVCFVEYFRLPCPQHNASSFE